MRSVQDTWLQVREDLDELGRERLAGEADARRLALRPARHRPLHVRGTDGLTLGADSGRHGALGGAPCR